MGLVLEKLANHWQFRFVTILACLALVTYAVVMPVHSSELLTASDFGATPSASGAVSGGLDQAQVVIHQAYSGTAQEGSPQAGSATHLVFQNKTSGDGSVKRLVESPIPWAGTNLAVTERLGEVVALYGDSKIPRDASDAIRGLGNSARQGDITAEFLYGEAYQRGLGLRQDVPESARWFARASADRKAHLGTNSLTAPATFDEAFTDYRNAAEAGQRTAELYLGLAYDAGIEVSSNYTEAAIWYRRAAAQGSVSATCNLGLMYLEGEGTPKDDVEAALWLNRAAARGSVNAQLALGRMYLTGSGVAKDASIGAMWLERAAAQGSPQAELTLSWLYEAGLGVKGNSAKAYMWINLASSDDPRLRDSRDEVGALVSEGDLQEGQKLTHDWVVAHSRNARGQMTE